MTATVIALLSIWFGVFGGLSYNLFQKKYKISFIKRILTGVFGSIFFIKFLSRLGFTPFDIVANNAVHVFLLVLNLAVSFCGGLFAVAILQKTILKNSNL